MRYMGRSGFARAGVSAVFGAVMLGGVFASPASAHDTGNFQDKDYKVTPVPPTPSYDSNTNQTTFTITLEGTADASHVTVVPCGSPKLVSATGPEGSGEVTNGQDPSTGHTGTKFQYGVTGTYTLVYEGNVPGLDFIVKNGQGHKHFAVGACTTETTTPTTPPAQETPPSEDPPVNPPATPAADPPATPAADPPATPAANQPSQPGTEVQGSTATQPGSDVLSSQATAPEAQSTLPRTGLPLPALAPIGTMLLALGGLATALGRRPRG